MFSRLRLKTPKMITQKLENLQITVPSAADDAPHIKNTCGRPNQAVTKPISLNADTGEVMVRKSTGKTKVRKGQSSDEYEHQRSHFFDVEKGPIWTPVGWMTKENPLQKLDSDPEFDISLKQARQKLISYCHILYYRKRYENCAQACENLITRLETLDGRKKVQKEIDELKQMLDHCQTHSV
ncbi:LAME_0D09318g1_1 [Lachancea meyersii CBS 8951]|uniref:LAME_0D09318g1_1 n=1 Tax=Lachancea meyersii CBS 8951 TaxID=1266667 RepID=A0A1G4JBA9_9SACH|nr:LAME_0D09318g1_1 [Lachancea meyersii CBS 8951]